MSDSYDLCVFVTCTCDDEGDSLEDVLEARKEQTGLVTGGSQRVLQPDVARDISSLTVFSRSMMSVIDNAILFVTSST